MTRLDLEIRLQNHFNNSVYYSEQDTVESIQDGLDEVIAFTGARGATGLINFVGNLTYYDMVTLLPGYIGVVSIFNQLTNRWMAPTSLKKLEADRLDWDTSNGSAEWFVPINFRYVAICRKPSMSGGSMLVYYRAAAPTLSNSLPIPIPDDHLLTLENYCRTDLAEQAQEWGKATTNFQEYVASLEKFRVLVRNQTNRDRQMGLK